MLLVFSFYSFFFPHGNPLYIIDYWCSAGVVVKVPNYSDYIRTFIKFESGEKELLVSYKNKKKKKEFPKIIFTFFEFFINSAKL